MANREPNDRNRPKVEVLNQYRAEKEGLARLNDFSRAGLPLPVGRFN